MPRISKMLCAHMAEKINFWVNSNMGKTPAHAHHEQHQPTRGDDK